LPSDEEAAIAIEEFVQLEEVDPIRFDRAYWVAPDGSARAYALLHRALDEAKRVAIARMVLRARSHLAAVRAVEDHLLVETMFFADELVDASQIPGATASRLSARETQLARQLIDSTTVHFDPTRYKDVRGEALRELIERKAATAGVTVEEKGEERGKIVDLMEALKRSLAAGARPKRARPRRAAHPRRKAG